MNSFGDEMRNGQKGQVSMMILAGLAILIVAVTGIYYAVENAEIDDSSLVDYTRGDSETTPVESLILGCMEETAEDAVRLISRNGGYIAPKDDYAVRPSIEETEMITRGPNDLPYWYLFDDEEARFKSHAPVLREDEGEKSIELQMEEYIDENIVTCFNGFRGFNDRFEIDHEDPESDVVISLDTISINLDMPTDVESLADDSSHKFEEYNIELDARLGRLHTFASDIADTQSEFGFIERPVLEMLSMHSGLDRPLPPFYDIEMFSPGAGEFWNLYEVYDYIRRKILPHTSSLQILYSGNYDIPSDTPGIDTASFEEIATQDLSAPSLDQYADMSVDFYYPSSKEPYISVGSDEPLLTADSGKVDDMGIITDMLSVVVRRYRFDYDITYPVIVRVCEDESFNQDGLCFYMAMEANIRNNEIFFPLSRGLITSPLHSQDGSSIDFDDRDMFVDRTVEFEVYDRMTGEPIDGVDLSYFCGSKDYIDTIEAVDGVSRFNGRLPFCAAGGKIILEHPDYHHVIEEWNNREGDEKVTLVDKKMMPLKEVEFRAVLKNPVTGIVKNMTEQDQILIDIQRKKQDPLERNVPLVTSYVLGEGGTGADFEDTIASSLKESNSSVSGPAFESILEYQAEVEELSDDGLNVDQSFELVPGEYEIKLTHMIHGDPAVHIPEDKIEEGWGPWKVTETLPEINMPVWVNSIITFDFEIGQEIYDADMVTFHVPKVSPPSDYGELEDFDSDPGVNINRFLPEIEVSDDE
ncbi:MAG: hypothetical protein ACLFSL_00785 [Candidatus Woesearchaeota archaeon]